MNFFASRSRRTARTIAVISAVDAETAEGAGATAELAGTAAEFAGTAADELDEELEDAPEGRGADAVVARLGAASFLVCAESFLLRESARAFSSVAVRENSVL